MLGISNIHVRGAAAPKDWSGAAFAGAWVSLANASRMCVVIKTGAWAGGTAAVTMEQATDTSGTSAKALPIAAMYTGTVASGTLTKTTVTSNTFNLAAANSFYIIEVDAAALDTTAGFMAVTVKVASPGTNSDFYSIDYLLAGQRYSS